ncbi:MAG TPA: kynureninase [Flavobacteriales bacterium]|nr:kynureninase [Flavobacteriales bacterium]HRE95717.1 kynureninase [Flavobacteriales bacterium]HRJ36524.1 kynureninase [Flavobacteriales bacterium]HRJ38221.1 kynureninase [Flavobacteriales bacterium]
MEYRNTLEFAREADQQDPLRSYRQQFHFPQHQGTDVVYFTGNSLGLQPKRTREHILQELDDWAKFGVEGHFYAKHPWFSYHENLTASNAAIVGALPSEVVCMNQLTVNIHLLMVSFYRPTPLRYKILCEAKAFPSDQYALETQVQHHGFRAEDAILEIAPREGEYTIRTEDILKVIEENKDSLALVMMGGVNYYTGQFFDIKTITAAAQKVGAYAGWDLAHAAGNVELHLHDWNVDFAAWCSYKYLNAGPGSVSGAFVHEKHAHSKLPRFAGWWGHDKSIRFKMEKGFQPMPGAEGWQLSNAPVLSMAAYKASLELFAEVGMPQLIKKSRLLSGYLEFLIAEVNKAVSGKENTPLEIITPLEWNQRGAQISMVAHGQGKDLFNKLIAEGVIPDWREPNVIRLAPVPMYNSFEDMFRFAEILTRILKSA